MDITGVKLRKSYQINYINTDNIFVKRNSTFIVETEHGIDIGRIIKCPKHAKKNNSETSGKIIRLATPKDFDKLPEIESVENKAFNVCKKKAKAKNLDMKLVSVKCLFDKTKIIFYFVAENRIDFRELVRELASVFKTRIEMRQIGVRDEAKLVGGFGPCGRHLCCVNLKEDFDPVSIKMAKEQNLNLNSLKISGMCGRLLCCLSYENELYGRLNRELPFVGSMIKGGKKTYRVESVEPLKMLIRIKKGDQIIAIAKNDLINNKGRFSLSDKAVAQITEQDNYEDGEMNNYPH